MIGVRAPQAGKRGERNFECRSEVLSLSKDVSRIDRVSTGSTLSEIVQAKIIPPLPLQPKSESRYSLHWDHYRDTSSSAFLR